jgi:hypothetical protein
VGSIIDRSATALPHRSASHSFLGLPVVRRPAGYRRAAVLYLTLVLLWVPGIVSAHGVIDQDRTYTRPPVLTKDDGSRDDIFIEAQYYVTETHAIVAMTTCLQIKKADGSWGTPPVPYHCVTGRDGPQRGKYQARHTPCEKDGVYRTRQWAHVEGDQGTIHLEHIGTSSSRDFDCTNV